MITDRLFHSQEFFQPTNDGEPVRSVVYESAEAVIVAWHINPGQRIAAHFHPHGQDTWTILSGRGCYQFNKSGDTIMINAGDVVVAQIGSVHGVVKNEMEPLRFISVVTPADAGYEPL